MRALLLDTETTGVDAPDVIQLAALPITEELFLMPGDVHQTFKPRKPISLGALATHHIIEDDLKDAPEWPGTWPIPEGVTFLIGHNIDFDWQAIGSPNVRRICTLALARSLWPMLDSHTLGAMTYHLNTHRDARELLKGAHDAMRDVYLTWKLLIGELAVMSTVTTLEALWAASERARVPERFTFGKYGPKDGKPGRLIAEIRRDDPGYIDWCIFKCDITKDEYWQRALRGRV